MINTLLITLLVSLAIQLGFFFFAFLFKTDKVTDLSYGLTFIILVVWVFAKNQLTLVDWLLVGMVVVWGIRLATYLFIRINVMKRDKRFDGIRESFSKFFSFWMFQGLAVWVILLPVLVVLEKETLNGVGLLSWIGVLLWLVGLVLETVADYQKFVFKLKKENKGKWIESGVWGISRHPNYLGEMSLWWGVFWVALPYLSGWEYLSIVGPMFITYILVFVSGIPPLEKKYDQRYEDNKEYQEYKDRVGLLFPRFV